MTFRIVLKPWVLLAVLLSAGSAELAHAQAPTYVPFQGYLTDSGGMAISGDVDIRFRFYDTPAPTGASEEILHEETQTVTVDAGHFSTYLGDAVAVDLAVFRDQPVVFVGVRVGADADEIQPLIQLATAPYAGFAQYCGDAETLGGMSATDFASAADVPWSTLSGIPADIDDGDDNTQLTEGQVDSFVGNNGYLTDVSWSDISGKPSALSDGRVAWSELTGIPADIDDGDANTQLNEGQVDAFVANNGYLRNTTRTRYYAIPGLAFVDQDKSQYLVQRTNWGSLYLGASYPGPTQTVYPTAPIVVPHGARLTAVRCRGLRNNSTDLLRISVNRTDGQGGRAELALVTAGSVGSVTLSSTLNELVDLANHTYYIGLALKSQSSGDSAGNLEVRDCRVTYTQTDL